MKKNLFIVICSVILLGVIFGIVDYNRIKNGEMPIFVIAQHDKSGPELERHCESNYYEIRRVNKEELDNIDISSKDIIIKAFNREKTI